MLLSQSYGKFLGVGVLPLENVALAALNVPDGLHVRARTAELTRPGGVELQLANTYEARDQTGFIGITVNRSRMVESVWIRPGWPDRIRPDGFPAVLHSTYMTAVQRALAVELAHRPVRRPSAPAPDDAYVDPAALSFEEWLSRTKSRLDAIDAEYDAIRRHQRAPQMDVTEIRSPLGYLTVQMRRGGPIAISGDPQALDNPSSTVLADEVLQLFSRAGLGIGSGEASHPAQPQGDDAGEARENCFESRVAEDDHFAELNDSGWLE
ncbi:hypothetical protein LZ318_05685 [Saccharopolyspora indica]|uniref:hypothetical protein n=1 Tax=Saccharopolyspora indica TaxID=1229659 RepID=UPI0022EA15E3|nr:hypothetical protein [Saccharopolyspora indica]MDA3646050.1 hypothetical protein [Saccharopolyspora indica]